MFEITRRVIKDLQPLRQELSESVSDLWRTFEAEVEAAFDEILETEDDSIFDEVSSDHTALKVNGAFAADSFAVEFNLPPNKKADLHSLEASISPEGKLIISGNYNNNSQSIKIPVRESTE